MLNTEVGHRSPENRPGTVNEKTPQVLRLAGFMSSEGAGDRTQDPQIKSLLLYQLSYAFSVTHSQ